MVSLLTDTFREPFAEENWIVEGKPTDHFYQFISQLSLHNQKTNEGIFEFTEYANLAAVQAVIQVPENGYTVLFTGQGEGRFRSALGPNGTWVLTSDDTTAVT